MKKHLVFVFVMLLGGAAVAATLNDQIEFSRSLLQTGKKKVIAENMNFTEKESADFWNIYQAYQSEVESVNDRLVTLIKDYAANINNLSPDQATKLISEHLDIQKDQIKLKEKYLSKFNKVLPADKVARFYQIENKIDSAVKYQMAAEIPLVGTPRKEVSQKEKHK